MKWNQVLIMLYKSIILFSLDHKTILRFRLEHAKMSKLHYLEQ